MIPKQLQRVEFYPQQNHFSFDSNNRYMQRIGLYPPLKSLSTCVEFPESIYLAYNLVL